MEEEINGEYERELQELKLAGFFDEDSDYDGGIGRCVEELLKVFRSQGHSGFSAARTAEIFAMLVDGKSLTPLKGISNEWMDVSECSGKPMFQNRRCSQVFASTEHGDGAYDINYFIFVDKNGTTFTRGDRSSIPISFPYMPRSRFVKARYSWIVSKMEKIKYALRQYY